MSRGLLILVSPVLGLVSGYAIAGLPMWIVRLCGGDPATEQSLWVLACLTTPVGFLAGVACSLLLAIGGSE